MRRTLVILFKLTVTTGIIAFVISRLGFENIVETMTMAKVRWLLAALGIFGLSGLLGVLQWKMLLSTKGILLSYWQACKLYFMGMFFNNFIFGFAAGDAVRIAYVKMSNQSGKAGVAATFLDRFAGLLAMMGFAFGGSLFLLNRGLIEGKVLTTAFLALFATFAVFCGILGFLISRRLQKLLFIFIDKFPVPKKEIIRNLVSQTIIEFKDRKSILPVAGLSLFIQFMRIGVHVLCGISLGLVTATNFHYFFIFVPILAILMILPLPFGIKESVGGALFAFAGFKSEAAVVMEFLASLVGILVSSVGGVLFLTHSIVPKRKLQSDEIINSRSALQ
ncbi:MAG: hypothetical protein GF401_12060 [Chitinivibrionales bacterium]|nr:hypothetical protein [Chitinivibrionales bacterium]